MKKLFFVFLMFFSLSAFADYSPIRYYQTYQSFFTSPESACADWVDYMNSPANGSRGASVTSVSQTLCEFHNSSPGWVGDFSRQISSYYSCSSPPSFTPSTSICSGTSPLTPPVTCTAGSTSHNGESWTTQGTAFHPTVCISGCSYDVEAAACGNGTSCSNLIGKGSGSTCTTSSTVSNNPEDDCLKKGLTFYTINNVTTCVPAGTSGAASLTKKTDSTNTTSTTASTGGTNTSSSSNTSTSTTTTYNNNTVTTTVITTTTDPATGNQTSTTSTTTKPTSDFCAQNPNDKSCKQSGNGTFGGTCGAFSCDSDDAIKCAMAKEQHQRNCQFYQEHPALNTLATKGQNYMDGTGDIGGTDPFKNPTSIDIGTLDQTATLSKSGLADQNFTIASHSVSIPFSHLNSGLEAAGKIVLAFAFMVAARILFT